MCVVKLDFGGKPSAARLLFRDIGKGLLRWSFWRIHIPRVSCQSGPSQPESVRPSVRRCVRSSSTLRLVERPSLQVD